MKCALVTPSLRSALQSRRCRRDRHSCRYLWLPLLFLPLSRHFVVPAGGSEQNRRQEQKIQRIVSDFRHRLGIEQRVTVSVVSGNSHLASATCSSAKSQVYEISFDAAFLRTLAHDELNAAVAHEMGHIWIFTHFPYLQTESLANQHALKLVSRSELQKVYEKMWKWRGEARGNLPDLLGPSAETEFRREGNPFPAGNR